MVVDLIRNDLAIIASNIKVEKFRYIDKIKAGNKELFQASSHISGKLEENWHENIGNLIVPLLPAGSITGTPKKKTVDLISKIEDFNREFFTGIWGIYDGEELDSSVLIRFLQKDGNNFTYKSGGGITIDSICENEYQEMQDKVYIP
jgi:para-aminobenzoate synthetase component 1